MDPKYSQQSIFPVADNDIEKTAVITPFGLYEYVTMPAGLKNAAQTFQRFIDTLFRDLPFVYAYIDDILVASKDPTEHINQVKVVLQRLHQAGIVINTAKCVFKENEVKFLGYSVNSQGIRPHPERTQLIIEYPLPK